MSPGGRIPAAHKCCMLRLDEQLAGLEKLAVPLTARADFQSFWQAALGRVKSVPLAAEFRPVSSPFSSVRSFAVLYRGLDGTPIHARLLLPTPKAGERCPCVLRFHGSTGSRGTAADHAAWLLTGTAVLAMDYRMQGGQTGSNTGFTGGPVYDEFIFGVADPATFYFFHVVTDALRLVELALTHPELDGRRLAVEGASQGGGTSLIVSALHSAVSLCLADMPSFCDMERRLFNRTGGARAVAELITRRPELLDPICATFSYFDNLNHAAAIRCPVLLSVGLKDEVCPPENVYAVYNRITAEKRIEVYPFAGHCDAAPLQLEKKLHELRDRFLAAPP